MELWILVFTSPWPQYIRYCILLSSSKLMEGGTLGGINREKVEDPDGFNLEISHLSHRILSVDPFLHVSFPRWREDSGPFSHIWHLDCCSHDMLVSAHLLSLRVGLFKPLWAYGASRIPKRTLTGSSWQTSQQKQEKRAYCELEKCDIWGYKWTVLIGKLNIQMKLYCLPHLVQEWRHLC